MKLVNKIKRFFTKQTIDIICIKDATQEEIDEFIDAIQENNDFIVTNKSIQHIKIKKKK